MEVKGLGIAGTLESSDIMITIHPKEKDAGRVISLTSPVKQQFGEKIVATIEEILDKYEVSDVSVSARDRGALDFTIHARMEAALLRAVKGTNKQSEVNEL